MIREIHGNILEFFGIMVIFGNIVTTFLFVSIIHFVSPSDEDCGIIKKSKPARDKILAHYDAC